MKTALLYLLCCLIPLGLILIAAPFVDLIGRFEAPISNGTQRGTVTAIDTQGYIWKTGTAFFRAVDASDQEDAYCVISNEVKTKLSEANISHDQVVISYDRPSWVGPWDCGREYAIIRNVEILKSE